MFHRPEFCKITPPLSAKLETPNTILLSLFLDDEKSKGLETSL